MPNHAELVKHAAFGKDLFSRWMALRRSSEVALEDLIVFLAVGTVNFDINPSSVDWVNPASISTVSEFLDMPRETTRRKLLALEGKGLLKRTSYGFVVDSLEDWKRLCAAGAATDVATA